jgi:hydrogenase maturation protease
MELNWRPRLTEFKKKPLLLVGIGNPYRHDDGAGPLIIAGIKLLHPPQLTLFNAGLAPEDCLPLALDLKPAAVILIDACCAGHPPGTILLFENEELPESFGSTHAIAPRVIGAIITKMAGSQLYYLGIQVEDSGFGGGLTPLVQAAVTELVSFFTDS